MFRFENPSLFYLFLLIAILIVMYIALNVWDGKRLRKYCQVELLSRLTSEGSRMMKHLKFGILMLALACLIVAAANPQTAGKMEKSKRKGVDVVFCLDVSNSMLARDIQPNRLEACKMSISRFIDNLSGDRVGVVVFAGTAYVQLPVTTDYVAAKMFINQISTEQIAEQGTDLSAALITAGSALIPDEDQPSDKEIAKARSKVIVLVSDGEDHFPENAAVAADLHGKGIFIHTIGIGSSKGTVIPVSKDGNELKKDSEGNTVITRLNEQALKDIANKGGGVYVHAKNTAAGFNAILTEIDKMEKSDIADIHFSGYHSWFQYPLALGILLLLVEGFLFSTHSKWKETLLQLRGKMRKTPVLLLIFALLISACNKNKTIPSVIGKGNEQFHIGDSLRAHSAFTPTEEEPLDTTGQRAYELALKFYEEAFLQEGANRNSARFNQIDVHYRLHEYDIIGKLVDGLLQMNASQQMASQILYNKGNALMQQGRFLDAVEAYKQSLRRNPSDLDAKYNLVYAKKMAETYGNSGYNQNGDGEGRWSDAQLAQDAADRAEQSANNAEKAAREAIKNGDPQATKKKQAAKEAREHAYLAQQAANSARQAELRAKNATSDEERLQAEIQEKNALQKAEEAAQKAEDANRRAGGQYLSDAHQAREAADRAEQSARNAEKAAREAIKRGDPQANRKKQAAEDARKHANNAQQAAIDASQAEQRAQRATNANERLQAENQAKNASQRAKEEAQKAETASQRVSDQQLSNAQQAQNAAYRAEQSANNAEKAAQDAIQKHDPQAAKKKQAAEEAREHAYNAQQAANNARQAEQRAQSATNSGERSQAENQSKIALQRAKDEAQKAESANRRVGGQYLSAAHQAQEAADRAEQSANNAENSAREAIKRGDPQATKKKQAAEEARNHANNAQQAANNARQAEQRAQSATSSGERSQAETQAKNAMQKAKDEQQKAEAANRRAGGQPRSDAQQAQDAADRAEQSANNAEKAASEAIKNGDPQATTKKQAAEEAREHAYNAQKAANDACWAEQRAQNATSSGERSQAEAQAKNALQKAKAEQQKADAASRHAGGQQQNGNQQQNQQNGGQQQNQRNGQQGQQNAATLRQLDALQNNERNTQNRIIQYNAREANKQQSPKGKQQKDW